MLGEISAQEDPQVGLSTSVMSPDAKVRGVTATMVALIAQGTGRSKTFHELVDRIGDTDGIVYVAEGSCGHDVRACLLFSITAAGTSRVLRVLVDPSNPDTDLIGSLAHELQHALEVLSVRYIRTDAAMALLYRRIGRGDGRRFETDAAIHVGDVVRAELRASK
jgi:hypothetical protein